MPGPLILTLALHAGDQERMDVLRRMHFPPERNYLAAHVTLFHKLPPNEGTEIVVDLRRVADRPQFEVAVTGVRFLGRGVALRLESPELLAVRGELAARWHGWLGPQDLQRFAPHVTVQNKVPPHQARDLYEKLQVSFVPYVVRASGLALWTYEGGPWSHQQTVGFAENQALNSSNSPPQVWLPRSAP